MAVQLGVFLLLCLQNEGGQRSSLRECGSHAAAEEFQMSPTGGSTQVFDAGDLCMPEQDVL